MTNFICRNANEGDVILYFDWVNEKSVRQNSVSIEPILLKDHKKWFLDRIKRSTTAMYVFELKDIPFGQVRFDIDGTTAFIDYSIDKNFRGKGLGAKILQKGIDTFLNKNSTNIKEIIGLVKNNNTPSAKVFSGLGFDIKEKKIVDSINYIVFVLKNNIK